jgi:hypothetical protein
MFLELLGGMRDAGWSKSEVFLWGGGGGGRGRRDDVFGDGKQRGVAESNCLQQADG